MSRSSRAASDPRPAVFFDRDGVVIRLVPYLARVEDLEVHPGAAQSLRRLRDAGYALVLVTNQSVIARGLLSQEGLDAIHAELRRRLRADGVDLDGVFVCPHHPDFGGPCACRKPEPGLILDAARSLRLDLDASYMVGDRWDDIEAARRAGVRGVLVGTGYGAEELERRSDDDAVVVDDVNAAAAYILRARGRR